MPERVSRQATTGSRPLIQDWFRVEQPEPGLFMIEEPLHDERVKSYLIVGTDHAILLDSGMGIGDLGSLVGDLSDRPLTIVNSHAHWDHIGGNRWFVGRAEIAIHEAEADLLTHGIANGRLRPFLGPHRLYGPLPQGFDPSTVAFPPSFPTRLVRGGESFDLGGRTIEIHHAPGHSPGLVVLLDRAHGALFSTDVAYRGSLYAHLPGSDLAAYRSTMARIAAHAPSLRAVYHSHNDVPLDPALLLTMRDAIDTVVDGGAPESTADGVATHRFADFSVPVPAPSLAEPSV